MRTLNFSENLKLASTYITRYSSVKNFLKINPETIRNYQFLRIKQLINLAYKKTEFYRNKYKNIGAYPEDIKTWKDFQMLPTVTKDELIEYGDQCVVSDWKNNPNVIISRSSGSSGKIIEVMEDGGFWIECALISIRMFQQAFNYTALDKQALIYTSEYPYKSIFGLYRAYYIFTLTPPEEIIRFLKNTKPNLIVSYPSILLDLIRGLTESDLKSIKPKAISTNSEYSSQIQRDYISKIFKCPVFDEYSSEELSYIAYQCKQQRYHIQEDSSYIEILRIDKDQMSLEGQSGEIVGTCLINSVMPFTRYRQGDLGSIESSNCSCGCTGRILNSIVGRRQVIFKTKNGIIINSGRLLDWTYELILNYKLPILQFQLTQTSFEKIDLNIIPTGSINNIKTQQIVQQSFKKRFGKNFKVKLNVVSSIEKTIAGKHVPIRSFI